MKSFFKCIVLIFCFHSTWALQISASHLKKNHPFFVTVTDMIFDTAGAQLQVSCKIFSDDFEKTLRKTYANKVDLSNAALKEKMDSIVASYFNKHLHIKIDGSDLSLKYAGYEQEDDAVICYLQADDLTHIKKVEVTNDLLFEYKPQQTNLVHITVGGVRKSVRLNNPEAKASFDF